ncbi:MAG TPA: GMC family oxidoreductase [Actinomycetota bacterium]
MPGYNIPDVLVVGMGGGGAVVAKELAEQGLGVVALEAGAWLEPARDFAGLEWEMMGQIDSVFRWGPIDRTRPPWPRVRDGLGFAIQTAGVGGNTLHYGGNSPRAYPAAVQMNWPIDYGELIPFYEKVEATLPVVVPDVIAPKDAAFIEGCERAGLSHVPGPDVFGAGWRIQPNAILPVASKHSARDGCTQCGGCLVGCRNPDGARADRTAKRGTNASYAPAALATGNCEIRTGCFATRVLVEERAGRVRVRGVRYRDANGKVFEQDAEVVVLAGGAVETPRLWLASGLPGSEHVGRGLTTHWFDYVVGIFPREVGPDLGQTSMARADFPGDGFLESQGAGPLMMALLAYGGGWPRPSTGPWATRGKVLGSDLKRRMEAYRHTLMIVCSVDDDASPDSAVTLSPDVRDEHNPAPAIRYRATPETAARRDRLARRAAEILIAAGAIPESIHRADAPPSLVHQMGTMRMAAAPADGVVDDACEAHAADGLFIADASVLPNGLGGANPTLTIQAVATRTAGKIADRYFGTLQKRAGRP